MSGRPPFGRGGVLSLLVALLLAAAGCGAETEGGRGSTAAVDPPTSNQAAANQPTSPDLARPPSSDRLPPTTAPDLPSGIVPTRISIPSISVEADVVDLDLRGPEPEVPSDFSQTGWYAQTRRPGEIGPAVIAGHIDSVAGPAVFARLDELVEGDEIEVLDDDGESRTFVVIRTGQYPKEALPDQVFAFEPEVELRLITCGGTFDRSSGHYRDNYVVYAQLRSGST